MRTLLLFLLFTLVAPAQAEPPETAYVSMVRLIDRLYLRPNEVDEGELLIAAAEGVSREVPWLMVERGPASVSLRHGSGSPIGAVSVGALETLPEALMGLEELVATAGYDLDGVDLRLAVLSGLTDALDRYSRILADDVKASFDVRLKGTLVGIGATLRWQDEGLVVQSVVNGGPADLGGVKVGDLLLRIDGRSVVSMPVSEATRRIRGDRGTQVSLSMQRGDVARDVSLTRSQVVVPNVEHRVLDGAVGYVKIENVSQKTMYNLVNALDSLRALGALERGLVLDLRGNTGGSMKEAARAADVFLEEGLLLRTVGRDGGRVQNLQERMTAGPGGDAVDIPLVVVVDARTASGSEILAGALVQLGRAVLVGSATYGKGSVQKLYPLGPDTDLKLTVAQYLLADDREIDGIGLVPDVVVGRIEFDAYGVQYPNWDEGRQQTSWDEIVPWVVADPLWHTGDGIDDLPLEVARRVVVSVNEPTRTAALDALGSVVSDLRIEEEGRLVAAMEQLGVNWSPAAASEALFVEADVRITAEPWEGRHDVVRLRAHVTNREGERLSRAMVRLSCATLDSWDGVVIPIGQVEAGQTVVGEVGLPLPAGIAPREDRVDVRLRVDDRPPLLVGSEILYAQSTAPPHVRITGRLVAEPSGVRRAEVTLINEANHPLHDLEVRFEWPGDLDVEIIDQAVRLPVVPARERVRADLSLIPGADAPEVLPMRVRVETSRFGRVARWPLDLPLDGSTVTLSAPRVSRMTDETSAVMGTWRMPVLVQDEGVLEYVVVYVNGKKIGWFAGGRGRLRVEPEVELIAGLNRIYIEAADDEGLVTRQLFEVRGEAVAAADAVEPEER